MIVLESLAEPSIFPLFKACSILSAIFTTSCAAELESSSQWGWFQRRPMHQVVISLWLKALLSLFMTEKRGTTSIGVDKQCSHRRLCRHSLFHLMLNSCSGRSESSYFTCDAPIFFWQWASIWPLSSFAILFFQSGVSKLIWGIYFHPGACIINVWHVIYMMNWPFEGWHMVVTLVWWNKNFYSCSNSTIEISWVMTIISPISPEFKILQEGLAQMQNKYIRSIHPKGRF
jgi:hypothetical protein